MKLAATIAAAMLLNVAQAQQTPNVKVLFFLRSDCPVSNLYAPEIQRIAGEFRGHAQFSLVFPDNSDAQAGVDKDISDYYGHSWLREHVQRDPEHKLVRETGVTMMPEAAVVENGHVMYAGRIDDRVTGLGRYRADASVHELENAIHAALEGKSAPPPGGPAYGCYIADAQ